MSPELCTDSLCECGCVRSGLAVVVMHQVDEMAEIATEAVEPPDDDHVSLPRRLEEGGEPRAVLTLSGRLVLVDRVVADAGLAQSIPLQVEALGTVRLRDPRVADQHWRLQNDRLRHTGEDAVLRAPPCVVSRVGFYVLQTSSERASAPPANRGRGQARPFMPRWRNRGYPRAR